MVHQCVVIMRMIANMLIRPERFLEEDVDMKGHDFRLLPFGAGRRVCPGAQLGINLVTSTLGHLLHHFGTLIGPRQKEPRLKRLTCQRVQGWLLTCEPPYRPWLLLGSPCTCTSVCLPMCNFHLQLYCMEI